jgi:hypothetical protein
LRERERERESKAYRVHAENAVHAKIDGIKESMVIQESMV